MKRLLFMTVCLFAAAVYGQDSIPKFDGHTWQAPYSLTIPKDWGIERFPLPPFFAPTIKDKGVEDIRFTPGWGNIKTEEYWSYAFVWCLDDVELVFSKESIERKLNAYYTGLIRINSDTNKISAQKSIPVTTHLKWMPITAKESMFCTGTIHMTDFMTQKEITLNCKMYVRACREINKTILFFELSPQPLTHPVWVSLDKLWLDFACKKD